jgi:hypothetical protein
MKSHAMPSLFPTVAVVVALASVGCGAPLASGRARTAAPFLTAASSERGRASGPEVERVLVVPRPARSFARLRGLLRETPAALAVVDQALANFQSFELDEPILSVAGAHQTVTSFGISRETASRLRSTRGKGDKCDALDVEGKPRIVCALDSADGLGDSGRALGAVTPPQVTSDLHMEMSSAMLARELRKNAGAKGLDALLGPLGPFSLDVSLEGTPEVRFAFTLDGKKGIGAALLEAPVARPPVTFFRLPADAEMAAFAHAPSAADQDASRETLASGLVDAMGSDCTVAEKRSARAEIEKLFFTGGSVSLAVGFDRARAEAAADAGDKRKLHEAERAWAVVGVEEPAERWSQGVTWLTTHGCGKSRPSVTVGKATARLGLPAGTLEVVDRSAKDGVVYTFVVPDGAARTWIAIGPHEASLAARVRASVGGATEATLAGRSGLGVLRGPATFGGFVTASSLAWLLHPDDPAGVRAARALPTAGRTPVAFRTAIVRDGAGGTVGTRVTMEPAALADLLALFRSDGT